ncbi:MAG: DNA translocase FtsK [Eubacteriales bacterium]|nr:DNA translocase FtsK [Eubacteriales bacterium]
MTQKGTGTTKKPGTTAHAGSSAGKKQTAKKQSKPIRREIGAVVCLFLGMFSFLGYFNLEAWFIDFFCNTIKGVIGWGYFVFPPSLLLGAWILGFHRGRPVRFRLVSALLLPVFFGTLAHMLFSRIDYELGWKMISQLYVDGQAMICGGVTGGALGLLMESAFSIYGAVPACICIFLVFLMLALRLTPARIAEKRRSRKPRPEYKPVPEKKAEPALEPKRQSGKHAAREEPVPEQMRLRHAIDIPMDEPTEKLPAVKSAEGKKIGFFNPKPRVRTPDQLLSGADVPAETEAPAPAAGEPKKTAADLPAPERFSPEEETVPFTAETEKPFASPLDKPAAPVPISVVSEICDPPKESGKSTVNEAEEFARTLEEAAAEAPEAYEFPPLDLLRMGNATVLDGREEISLNRERLDATLKSFGIGASIRDVTRGPTVTRYDLELEAGVKLNKLTNLAGDLALSLGVLSVRIAPIPDKISTVGIEVPNKLVSTVYLRDIVSSPTFRNAQGKLSFAIGKDIAGSAIVGDIAKLPHMLIAGTTGSGKSVCMNSLIISLLYKSTPDEVRLIMIDPKMVELGIYNGIPHLYVPVVTDPKKAAGALQWAVVEMMKRYRLFSEVGVRDLAGYNAYRSKVGEPTMPQVVIVIDELADLMLVASKEVEESICRVAQMGRASGMHLVIATQRPSSDVITGLMKANIPSRIAFAVSSALESRIILDQQGAEKLIGMGDMLYAPLGSGKPIRVQGAFISDEEREKVIDFIKGNAEACYSNEIMDQIERAAAEKSSGAQTNGHGNHVAVSGGDETSDEPFSEYDELLPQAVDVIFDTKQASVSMLQRRLKLGYARAARLVDQMEEIGVVGPFEGSKPRQILITKEQWQEMQFGSGRAPVEQICMEEAMLPESDDGEETL